MATSITYNSFDLQTSSYITAIIDDDNSPDKQVSSFGLPRTNGVAVTDVSYSAKPIQVRGTIVGTTATIEQLIVSLKAALAVDNQILAIGYTGFTMQYRCVAPKVTVSRPTRGSNWAKFEITFT